MIDLNGMVSIPFLKKAVFTGSERGNEFSFKKAKRRGGPAGPAPGGGMAGAVYFFSYGGGKKGPSGTLRLTRKA